MTGSLPRMWADGSDMEMVIQSPNGPLYHMPLPLAVKAARMAGDSEILRFTWEWIDPEDGTVTRGAARIVVQEIEPPSATAEVQPPGAEATASGFQMPDLIVLTDWPTAKAIPARGAIESREQRRRRLQRVTGPLWDDPDEHLVPHSSGPAIHINWCAGHDCIGHDDDRES